MTAASSFSANENNSRIFEIYATITGSANLTLAMNQTTTLKQTGFFGDNSGYTGKLTLRGRGKFAAVAETGLGGNPSAFAANQVAFEGQTFIATNSFVIDDANRGFTLNNTLNTGSHIYPGGFFEVTGTNALAVACPIAGAGPLGKRGTGTLTLSGANTYTGLTTVEAGTLRLASGASHALSSTMVSGVTARVIGEGVLSNVTLVAGGRLGAEKGGWDLKRLDVLNTTNATFEIDLSEADPAVTLIRVAGEVSKLPLQVFQFVINTNNALEVPYQLLSASNLATYADHDFCVTPPWFGELSRVDDGLGGQVLLFTPTPPEKIVFQVAADPINTTAFMLGDRWSDGLAPTNPPTGVKTYVSRTPNIGMRTPYDRALTFGGKRLILDNVNLTLKGANVMSTVTDLTMMHDAIFSTGEPVRDNFAGNILLRPVFDTNRVYAMRISGGNAGRDVNLNARLSGYGDLFLQNTGNPAYSNNIYNLLLPSTNFYGKTHVEGHTNFWLRFTAETALGANPPYFRADQLRFNGGGISVTNDVALDDANRGVTLLANGGYLEVNDNGGAFPTGTPVSNRVFAGGVTLRAEGASTLTVACPITGPGRLVKNGSGRLVLGGANTYTGQTEIVAGRVDPVSASAFGSGPLLVKGQGRLLRRHPDATLPDGVALGSAVDFEAGAAVEIDLDDAFAVTGDFTVPLFTVPTAQVPEPDAVPVTHGLQNYAAEIITADLGGGRTQVSVRLIFQGTLILIQ